MAPRVAIIIYSMYGHIANMALEIQKGIKEGGGEAKIFQIPETLPEEVLTKMHAPPKKDFPILNAPDLENYDAFMLGVPTRYGNFPGQWKAFWDTTGSLWQKGALWGKYAGIFVSSGTQGGGQESTVLATMSTLAHHGIIYVPLGYKHTFHIAANNETVHGGGPFGSGQFAGADGSRQPNELEKEMARIHGKVFYESVSKVSF